MRNLKVRHKVLNEDGKLVDDAVDFRQLRKLGHVFHMPNHMLARRAMLSDLGVGWDKTGVG